MAIDFKHREYEANIDKWNLIDNICEFEDVEQYLIKLNPDDDSSENTTRNNQYKKRAVFYQIAGKTVSGLVSMVFKKWPSLSVPTQLEYLNKNADGAGMSIFQQSQDVVEDVIKVARNGLFVTYPETEATLSRADMDSGNYFATIHEIDAQAIRNWRLIKSGAQVKLGLVVFEEEVEEIGEDGYSTESVKQLRELSLEGNVFIDRKWRKTKDKKDEWYIFNESIPTDGAGRSWSEIPFTFVGATSNSADVDDSIMYGLAKLNVGHYRNSADYEDSVWYCGQAQPWMSGINQSHIDLMKENNMYVGARQLLGVPTGEQFAFASAPPNTLVKEAMDAKIDAMIGMGARFIMPNTVAKTAKQAGDESAMSLSALAMIASNVSEAYTQCIRWCAKYMNVTLGENDGYALPMDFVDPDISPQEIQVMIAGFVQGAIPASDYFRWLKRADLTDEEKTLEEWQAEVDSVSMPDLGASNGNTI